MPDIEVSTSANYGHHHHQTPSGGGGGQQPPDSRERKEERRRERRARRERRLRQRQTELSNHLDAFMFEGGNHLPDLLNSHVPPPPPYATLPQQGSTPVYPGAPQSAQRGGWRASISSFSRRRRCVPGGEPRLLEDDCKSCCGVLVSQSVSIRWFIVMIAFVGICCAVVGTVLGAMKASGREHLTVSLLMIGVGIVLITVSGIAWRLTSRDAPSCRAMMGLDPHAECGDGRFMARHPFPRNTHPYAGMLYSDFQYRPPPPSYQASMQEYRLRLLLMDRNGGPPVPPPPALVSPPPAYRGPRLGLPLQDVSRPPSYRSRASEHHHAAMAPVHARHSSQLSYLSQQTIQEDPKDPAEHASVVPVIPTNLHKASIIIHGGGQEKDNYISNIQDEFQRVNLSVAGTSDGKAKNAGKKDDGDVTIVQSSEAPTEGQPVVVTVSAAVDRHYSPRVTPEVDILAHL